MAKLKPFTMPKWGIEMSEGTIAEWMVAEGEPFRQGAVLTLIETDKITNEVEAESDGRFVRILATAGETYPVGALLAVLSDGEADAAEVDALIASFKQADTSFDGDGPATTPSVAPAPMPAPPAPQQMVTIPDSIRISPAAKDRAVRDGVDVTKVDGTGRGGRITVQDIDQATRPNTGVRLAGPFETSAETAFASPMARRLARLHGIKLEDIVGTGPRGRIAKEDILAAVAANQPQQAARASTGEVAIQPMSSMRRTIARRLTEAKANIPHFYVRRRVRADHLMAFRATAIAPRPSVNDYLIRACALALMEVPEVNIQVHGTDIHRFLHADIAVAVATPNGLITPIVTHADDRDVAAISSGFAALAQRARAGKLTAEEFTGGSFSLSNLGSFGVEQFDAIINPPQGAILAVGKARPEPIDDDGAIRIVPVLHLSLSCDHRAIDGADAGRFMAALAALIEHPERL